MGTAIIVLGGHRSGTSCVAGIIHRLGVPLGEHLLGPGVGNPVGHFEDLAFYHLHRLILGENRDPKAWRYPGPTWIPSVDRTGLLSISATKPTPDGP